MAQGRRFQPLSLLPQPRVALQLAARRGRLVGILRILSPDTDTAESRAGRQSDAVDPARGRETATALRSPVAGPVHRRAAAALRIPGRPAYESAGAGDARLHRPP